MSSEDVEQGRRRRVNWLLVVGGVLFAWAVVAAVNLGGSLPAVGWLVALLGLALAVVGLLRPPR